MGSEAMEDCVQGALSSLYPPFESTAPPLLSQVFSVLESTYQHDSLRYLLDYFVPAKHLLHKLQQHACSQYLGCLFLHSGWPLCLGEKVVVQLSTLDWRLLRSNDFYLQVVPFSTRCPRLALKCLAPGGRTVQEILVPESQHPLVFTSEWLHSVNKERGHKREVGGGLDTCLVSTCDGVARLPWKEVVYPKFIHDPSEELGLMPNHEDLISNRLPSEGGSSLGGWGGSSSGELDSWSWDEEDDDDLPPDGLDSDPALPRRRRSEDGLGRTARHTHLDGDYVELLEPRGGPDGGVDPRQRYLEMHGICKTKTLPLCRRGKAIKLRKGKAWGYGKMERSGSFRAFLGTKGDVVTPKGEVVSPRPLPGAAEPDRGRRSYSSSVHDSDEGDKISRDSEGLESHRLYFDGPFKERRPGVGRERDSNGLTLPCRDNHKSKDSKSSNSSVTNEIHDQANHDTGHVVEGHSDHGSHSDSVFEDTDKPLSGDSDATTPTSDAPERPFHGISESGEITNSGSKLKSVSNPKVADVQDEGKVGDRVCPRGKEVKTAGFRAPRRKRKGKGAKGRARSAGRSNQKGSKMHGKSPQPSPTTRSAPTELPITEENQSEQTQQADEPDGGSTATNKGTENTKKSSTETEAETLPVCNGESDTSLFNHSNEEAGSAETCPSNEQNGLTTKPPVLLRELDADLLQSGKLKLTGTVDRLGRALVFSETDSSEEGFCAEDMAHILACYHRITRPAAKEKGLTVLMDSRRSPLSALCISALKLFQVLAPGGLGSVLVLVEEQQESLPQTLEGAEVHVVRGTGVLQQYIDKQQLPKEIDGDFTHCHSDWLTFRLSLESLTERCESALSLLGEALQSMETEPLPDTIKAVPQGIDKHRQLMTSVLADQRLTELQQRGGAWLAGLTNSPSGLAQKSPDCRAALAATSKLYDSVDDALHRLVRESNQRGRDLEALGRLAVLADKLEKCDKEIEQVQSQLDDYKDPPLSLSRLSLKQQRFKTFRETANELHSETLSVLSDLEGWCELDWAGLSDVQIRLPPVREKLRDMSHCLSDCWTTLDNTQRLLSTLTEATQWCDAVSSTSPSSTPTSTCPLASLPPIPPSRFQDARSLAMELGGGALLDLWTQTVERYQRTVAQVKPRFLQSDRTQNQGQGKPKTPSASSLWDLMGPEGEGDWGLGAGGGEGGLQSWGSLASLFRPQTCSTLKIGEEKGNKKEGAGGSGAGGAGGGKFLQNLLNPAKKSPTEAPLPTKPPRKRHPSFDLQALLAPRRGTATPKPAESPVSGPSRTSPMSWLGRRALADPVIATSMATAIPGWGGGGGGGGGAGAGGGGGSGGGGGVLIRGVEVSSKEVVDHTGSPRQHVLLGRTERETGTDRAGSTAQSKLYLLWCRMLSSERQYVTVLKGVEETYLPLLELSDTPASIRGKAESLFPNWASLCTFHSQNLLPAMEGALLQSLLQQDCFSKYREQFLQYSHYIRTKPDLDSPLVSQASDFFKSKLPLASPLSPMSFPHCLQAPILRLEQYCEALEELGGINPASDSALSILRHAQRHGEDLRASDLIVGCPIPVAERGELVRQGELTVYGGARRKRGGIRSVFLYQYVVIFTKQKSPSPGRTAYNYKHSIKTGEMGLTQNVGEDGMKFEIWVRQAPRTRDCITLQAQDREGREAWTHDIAHLLWTHAINNTELCLKESLCMGISSKLLLDASGTQGSELDSIYSLNDRVHSSCSDSSSVGSQKEGGSPASGRDPRRSSGSTSYSQSQSPSTAV
ncbi:rho guanine nucleotide exchange factor 40 isoform X2 [Mugil cephalus]|uniref:rho guanine nucleotide exchange factor 40 isoform X2 n=1 Tax=Mugil cephalus TaxID=48193 RepID=UPI001FB7A62C|nr:rho guanine nucleotide exchange factor 40 isoform X2 [Mugil cephalus]XP_047450948.1 rho guanine nucleotide exchange factor 40 isoform X2 [Mugil cephalus]